ncbi:hypothetical protein UCRPC4_g00393 [Phaeomoniella chlamydospora]|uniref:BHLH domain-containing protein n=1 Tax=Phaeomoniella chlamydospora TaxID=158046 RepID=A0A0G2F2R1_PHACM|nr:hypothetical protein UCRPC4_g00393 [Phaeomoniella chlamydospora]
MKPVVPLKAGRNSPRVASPKSPVAPAQVASPLAATMAADSLREDIPISLPRHSPPTNVMASGALPNEHSLEHLEHFDVDDQPGSRFSATTVATTVRGSLHSSPRASVDAPPVPALPSTNTVQHSPVQHPAAQAMRHNNAKINARKPAPTSRASTDSKASVKTKSLPQCPPETQAVDKISGMEARLDDLARRRRNIAKVLKDLNHVINPTSPGYDLKTKSDVKQTVVALENELSDIGQEEHEVGLKLHRAQKKRDKADIYEPSSLWIKRVTS